MALRRTKTGRPDMRIKENRYNPDFVQDFSELDKAREEFVKTAQEAGILENPANEGYETLLTQNKLPDMRLAPNRHNPVLVRAYGKMVLIEDRLQKEMEEKIRAADNDRRETEKPTTHGKGGAKKKDEH